MAAQPLASADEATKPWAPPAGSAQPSAPRTTEWGRALPFVGPVVLFIV